MQRPTTYPENPDAKMPPVRLSEENFAVAMESFTIVGTDVLFVNRARKTIFLAHRIALPLQGFWMIGGRMFAGEPEFDSMRRIVKRETSLELPIDRFELVTFNRYLWATRAQEPHDKGSDNLCYTFIAELSPEEIAIASHHLDPDEYDAAAGLTEFDAARLEASDVHQAIKDPYALVFPPAA
jgi:ADP-ribose pyrophosphatase YjhB (NUDIX family)